MTQPGRGKGWTTMATRVLMPARGGNGDNGTRADTRQDAAWSKHVMGSNGNNGTRADTRQDAAWSKHVMGSNGNNGQQWQQRYSCGHASGYRVVKHVMGNNGTRADTRQDAAWSKHVMGSNGNNGTRADTRQDTGWSKHWRQRSLCQRPSGYSLTKQWDQGVLEQTCYDVGKDTQERHEWE
ncbi:MAG: hypothetical protein J3Q66DRAFT_437934 [Benniella sp.]|nr:MAG: hypothetical protein J3Q66DRAFT_437934 [Benniella sp.]